MGFEVGRGCAADSIASPWYLLVGATGAELGRAAGSASGMGSYLGIVFGWVERFYVVTS
jgi:hypothetical protein